MKIQNLGQAMGIEIPLIVPVVLIIYMIAILAIGLWSARKVKNSEDWFVGGRSMGPWITALAHGSSSLGGGMYIAGPQYGWEAGASALWAANVIKITRHNYHPISVFIKNKDRVILFCGTMDFLSNTMKQMFSSASKSCILYLMLSYSV